MWQRQPHSSKQQPTEEKRGQVEKENGQGERESGERGKREEQEEEKKETGEEGKEVQKETDKEVEEVNRSDATPTEVNLTDDKVEDVMRRILKDEDAYVTMPGKVLRTSEKLKSCRVTDGCTIQVTSRVRGGGKHKDKKSKGEKKQVAQLDDGMCAMACEQMKWITESASTLQSTEEEKRRLAEEVDKERKMMAGVEKQVTGEDLRRMAEMEEGLKKFEEEVQAKGVDNQEMVTNFEDKGEKKVTRERRGCAGLVQGVDETHRMNKTCGKSEGKGNGGKGEHGGKGDNGGKSFQQNVKMLKGEEETRSRWRLTWRPVAHTPGHNKGRSSRRKERNTEAEMGGLRRQGRRKDGRGR